jgi:integrase
LKDESCTRDFLPQTRPAEETHAYSLEEILTMIDAVPEPAATMIATAAFTGARRGELRGMFLGELP